VTRSSNPEGRGLQEARQDDGRSVEQRLVDELAEHNHRVAPGGVGPFGAVFAPMHSRPAGFDLAGMDGLFLAPGIGAQGATLEDVAACFADCPDRVLVSASRSLLEAGPDTARLGDALAAFATETIAALA
jgi:orotidine-5'-phosphate decarboxylase